jgi:hypothetical protein
MMAKSLGLRSTAVLIIACLSVWACATVESDYIPGSAATTTSSPAFQFRTGLRVAVLPFTVLGNPEKTIDISEADRLGLKLQSIGITVIESLIFQEQRYCFQGLIPEKELDAIQEILDIDYLVFGTVNYEYSTAHSLFGKGYHYPSSATVRFVDTTTGEIVMISTTKPVQGSMAEEIGDSIINHVFSD